MPLRTRALTQTDIPGVALWLAEVPLWRRYRLTREKAEGQLQAALAAGDLVLVADRDEARACGLAWCLPRGMFGRSPYLKLFGVQSEAAGKGVGSRLLEELEARLAGDLFLLVSDFNADAQRFYRRHGFAQLGRLEGYILPEVAELLFHKPLKGFPTTGESGSVEKEEEREKP